MAAHRQEQFLIVEEASGHENSSRDPGDSAGNWTAAGQFLCEPQEPDGRKARSSQLSVVSGRCGATATRGPDSEPCGNGERFCGTRANRFRGDRQGTLRIAQREYSNG